MVDAPKKLVSLAGYAKLHGASTQAASKWKSRGHLVIRDGKVDVEASDERMRGAGLGRFGSRAGTVGAPPAAVAGEVAVASGEPPVADIVDALIESDPSIETLEQLVTELSTGPTRTAADAVRIKENALALKHSIEALKAARSVVDVDLAETVLFESARHERDVWLNFPAKVGPLLAADLKLEPGAVTEALTAHVHRTIEELGEPEADFTVGGRE